MPIRLSWGFHFLQGFVDHILLSFIVLLIVLKKFSAGHFMVATDQTGE